MKELEKHNKVIDKIQIESVIKKNQQQELKYIESIKPKSGHNLWEINLETLEVKLAEYKVEKYLTWEEAMKICQGGVVKKEVIMKINCVYLSALNAENALKRYLSGKGSAQMESGSENISLF
jgi:hypothetical protein